MHAERPTQQTSLLGVTVSWALLSTQCRTPNRNGLCKKVQHEH